jgi:hypothetical protein
MPEFMFNLRVATIPSRFRTGSVCISRTETMGE